jgi:tripeptidyl-peptidase-1
LPFINEESSSSLSISKKDNHIVIFALKQNFDKLEKKLYDVSTPSSVNYRKHLSRQEVGAISINPNHLNQLLSILSSINGLTIISKTMDGEYITVKGNVELFEAMFQSLFHKFTHEDKSAIRMKEYSLPKCLSDIVGGVLNVVDLPFDFEKSSKAKIWTPPTSSEGPHQNIQAGVPSFQPTSFPTFNGVPVYENCTAGDYGSSYCTNFTIASPQLVSALFNINNNTGIPTVSQAVYEHSQTISIADLHQFETAFGLPLQNITEVNNGTEYGPCTQGMNLCGEANLDVQILTAIAQNIPTQTWWYDDAITNMFNGFIIQMANSTDPPLVMSMSYAWYEGVYTSEQLLQWNTEAIKLGIIGVTILSSAGDQGVSGPWGGSKGSSFCGYGPLFPASSPYITVVGGTQGYPEQVPAQCNLGGTITTGGGFSSVYSTPSWQEANVASYFKNVSPMPYTTSDPPIDDDYLGTDSIIINGTYNPYGRGYPDVAAFSSYVWVNVNGTFSPLSGTSVATPVFAAMVSLANAANVKSGFGSLGFLNLFLYLNHETHKIYILPFI